MFIYITAPFKDSFSPIVNQPGNGYTYKDLVKDQAKQIDISDKNIVQFTGHEPLGISTVFNVSSNNNNYKIVFSLDRYNNVDNLWDFNDQYKSYKSNLSFNHGNNEATLTTDITFADEIDIYNYNNLETKMTLINKSIDIKNEFDFKDGKISYNELSCDINKLSRNGDKYENIMGIGKIDADDEQFQLFQSKNSGPKEFKKQLKYGSFNCEEGEGDAPGEEVVSGDTPGVEKGEGDTPGEGDVGEEAKKEDEADKNLKKPLNVNHLITDEQFNTFVDSTWILTEHKYIINVLNEIKDESGTWDYLKNRNKLKKEDKEGFQNLINEYVEAYTKLYNAIFEMNLFGTKGMKMNADKKKELIVIIKTNKNIQVLNNETTNKLRQIFSEHIKDEFSTIRLKYEDGNNIEHHNIKQYLVRPPPEQSKGGATSEGLAFIKFLNEGQVSFLTDLEGLSLEKHMKYENVTVNVPAVESEGTEDEGDGDGDEPGAINSSGQEKITLQIVPNYLYPPSLVDTTSKQIISKIIKTDPKTGIPKEICFVEDVTDCPSIFSEYKSSKKNAAIKKHIESRLKDIGIEIYEDVAAEGVAEGEAADDVTDVPAEGVAAELPQLSQPSEFSEEEQKQKEQEEQQQQEQYEKEQQELEEEQQKITNEANAKYIENRKIITFKEFTEMEKEASQVGNRASLMTISVLILGGIFTGMTL